jgi:succinate-acetate transporter protein
MPISDLLAITVFVSFGLWWLLLPQSVARFYPWFHRRKIKMPEPIVIRIIGGVWIIIVFALVLSAKN